MIGHSQTIETRKKISKTLKGRAFVERIQKECLICHSIFLVIPCKNFRKYCSKNCQGKKVIWNKGKHWNKETKSKMSIARLGKEPWNKNKVGIYSEETIVLMKIANRKKAKRGEDHPMWRGGITPINAKIRASLEYEEWRKTIFERDLYTCQICFEVGGRLEADHIKSFAYFPELRLELSNGRTLCKSCHMLTDNYGSKGRRANTPSKKDRKLQAIIWRKMLEEFN